MANRYIMHDNVVYEEFVGKHCVGFKKSSAVDTKTQPYFSWNGGKFDLSEWDKVLAFLLWTQHEYKSESLMNFYFDDTNNRLFALPVPQFVGTGMTVTADTDNKEMWAKHYSLSSGCEPIGTVHHHCTANAFQSGTDKADEINKDGLHITIGNLDKERMSYHGRVSFFKEFFVPNLGEWFDLMNPVLKRYENKPFYNDIVTEAITAYNGSSFPEEWKEFCTVKKHVYGNSAWGNMNQAVMNYGRTDSRFTSYTPKYYSNYMRLHTGVYTRRDFHAGINEFLDPETGVWVAEPVPSAAIYMNAGVSVAETYVLSTIVPQIQATIRGKNAANKTNTTDNEGLVRKLVISNEEEMSLAIDSLNSMQITNTDWMFEMAIPIVEEIASSDKMIYEYNHYDTTKNCAITTPKVYQQYIIFMEDCCTKLHEDLVNFLNLLDTDGIETGSALSFSDVTKDLETIGHELKLIERDSFLSTGEMKVLILKFMSMFDSLIVTLSDIERIVRVSEYKNTLIDLQSRDEYCSTAELTLSVIDDRWQPVIDAVGELYTISGMSVHDINEYASNTDYGLMLYLSPESSEIGRYLNNACSKQFYLSDRISEVADDTVTRFEITTKNVIDNLPVDLNINHPNNNIEEEEQGLC